MFTVLVCRGCCCGTDRKHPDVDHARQLDALSAAASSSGARLRVVDCLDVCARSNVVVVRDRREVAVRRSAIWLGEVLAPETTEAVCAWIASGGPSVALPEALAAHEFAAGQRALPFEFEGALIPVAGQ